MIGRLDEDGCLTLALPAAFQERTEAFLRDLDEATCRWFEEMTRDALRADLSKPGAGYDPAVLRRQKAVWDALPAEERERELHGFSPATAEGRARLFNSKKRKRATEGKPYGDYLRHIVQRAKQGNTAMALSKMWHAWTDAGFGMWAHVVAALGLEIAVEVARLLSALGMRAKLSHHFPHVIYKPEDGAALGPHHDQITPQQLVRELRAHVASEDPSTLAWAKTHGLQLLSHLEGGRSADGATYIIGPMTCERLLMCLEFFGADSDTKTRGPYFYEWDRRLEDLNVMLRARGQPRLCQVPIAPRADEGGVAGGAFVAGWPVGFPHGSFKSKRRRVTITMPFDVRETPSDHGAPDSVAWLTDLSALVEEGEDTAAAAKRVRERTRPFADGSTHSKPSVAKYLYVKNGWFNAIGPTRAAVEQFVEAMA